MKIRSLTVGLTSDKQSMLENERRLSSFVAKKNELVNSTDIELRTTRLTLCPINLHHEMNDPTIQSIAAWTSSLCIKNDMRWFCMPFDFSDQEFDPKMTNLILNLLKKFPNAFSNIIVANDFQINSQSVNSAAELIKRLGKNSNNGFDNFRLGISSNCRPHTPFFPFSYHEGESGFSIALEVLDIFFDILEKNQSEDSSSLRLLLIDELTNQLVEVNKFCRSLEKETGLIFYGIDSSLAPFPDGSMSVGRLIEMIIGTDVGSNGTVFCTAYLTNIIDQAFKASEAPRAGFNGVMYSVLEDDYLAAAIKNKNITIDSLALYSTVCGCGLDMVPVPGDIFVEEIASIIFDIAALSIALNKPLGTRLLPIPGKSMNEITDFNYDFLVDTRIMEVKNSSINLDFLSKKIVGIGKR
jgi:uncharacterized protein|tara:strand:+ start:853 stop:2085 length:1233 start_codon:yes stop_codon:yes gene_type:complete